MDLAKHYSTIKLYSTMIYCLYKKLARLEFEGKYNSEETNNAITIGIPKTNSFHAIFIIFPTALNCSSSSEFCSNASFIFWLVRAIFFKICLIIKNNIFAIIKKEITNKQIIKP